MLRIESLKLLWFVARFHYDKYLSWFGFKDSVRTLFQNLFMPKCISWICKHQYVYRRVLLLWSTAPKKVINKRQFHRDWSCNLDRSLSLRHNFTIPSTNISALGGSLMVCGVSQIWLAEILCSALLLCSDHLQQRHFGISIVVFVLFYITYVHFENIQEQ